MHPARLFRQRGARAAVRDQSRARRAAHLTASALATVAETLYGLDKSSTPFTYFQLLLPIFAPTTLGGIGQPLSAVTGGFVVAFSEVEITYACKKFRRYPLPGSGPRRARGWANSGPPG